MHVNEITLWAYGQWLVPSAKLHLILYWIIYGRPRRVRNKNKNIAGSEEFLKYFGLYKNIFELFSQTWLAVVMAGIKRPLKINATKR